MEEPSACVTEFEAAARRPVLPRLGFSLGFSGSSPVVTAKEASWEGRGAPRRRGLLRFVAARLSSAESLSRCFFRRDRSPSSSRDLLRLLCLSRFSSRSPSRCLSRSLLRLRRSRPASGVLDLRRSCLSRDLLLSLSLCDLCLSPRSDLRSRVSRSSWSS